jgi:hypothetical protein
MVPQEIYRNANGEVWLLIRESDSGQWTISHEKASHAGKVISELDLLEFLNSDGSGLEYEALKRSYLKTMIFGWKPKRMK